MNFLESFSDPIFEILISYLNYVQIVALRQLSPFFEQRTNKKPFSFFEATNHPLCINVKSIIYRNNLKGVVDKLKELEKEKNFFVVSGFFLLSLVGKSCDCENYKFLMKLFGDTCDCKNIQIFVRDRPSPHSKTWSHKIPNFGLTDLVQHYSKFIYESAEYGLATITTQNQKESVKTAIFVIKDKAQPFDLFESVIMIDNAKFFFRAPDSRFKFSTYMTYHPGSGQIFIPNLDQFLLE